MAPLELHIWGPAFGLPSIDAECIAAVAYLNASLPLTAWTLVASYDPSLSPTKDFPALRDGSKWIGGFISIAEHVRQYPAARDIDAELDAQQRADSTAFASFLHSAALPLVDLSLYTSFQNYYHATGPAWTKLLPFPLNYTIPPRRRAAARKRTAHLGLSSLDVDTVHDSPLETPSQRFEAEKKTAGLGVDAGPQPITTTQSPGMLPFSSARRKTILDKTQHSSLFRLSSLLSNLCDPLNDLLGDKLYLQKASSPTSLDCLALGYLSQIVYPRLPMSVLSEKINSRYPSLVTYVRRLHASLLDGRHEPSVVLSLAEFDSDDKLLIQARKERGLVLPWTPQVKPSLAVALLNGSREVFSSLPGVSRAYSEPTITTKESTTTLMAPYNPAIAVGTTLFGAVVATLHYFMTVQRTDNLTFVNPNRARQRGFGDLGAVLGFSNI